jgi:ATP-dependent protease ClpP protease subunit
MKKQGVFLSGISAESTDAVIDVVGIIGWEVAFTELKKMFSSLPQTIKRVIFDIYSPGGDVWDGNGIVQAIGELGKTRETVARVQVAASMATLIAVACKSRSIASNGRFLIHNPWTMVQGDAQEMEKRAVELRACEAEMSAFYSSRTGKTTEEMLALMNEERWLMPEETKAFGFVQTIDDPFKEDDVAAVKAEIQAAGKWPQALVEIPKQEEKTEDKTDEHANSEGGEGEGEGNAADSGNSDDATSAFERGTIEGRTSAEAQFTSQLTAAADQIVTLKGKINDLDALQRRTQGERDSARAQAEKLSASLKEATDQIGKLLSGGMSFAPSCETWADALKQCGGDYEAARKKYPDLFKAQREQDKTNRK